MVGVAVAVLITRPPSMRTAGAHSRSARVVRSAPRPRWCRPWIEGSLLPIRLGDLAGGEAHEVAQHDDLALLLGERLERLAQRDRRLLRVAEVLALVELADLLAGDRAAGAHVVDRDVARDPEDPGGERHGALLVLRQHHHQLREDVLRDVLGLVVVADDRPDVAVDVVGVADVQEAEGLLVAGLGAGDGLRDQAVAVGTLGEVVVGAESPGEPGRARVRRPLRETRRSWCGSCLPCSLRLGIRAAQAARPVTGGVVSRSPWTYAWWLAAVRLDTPSFR